MKTIKIKGSDYVMVKERLKAFRSNFKGYALISEIIDLSDTVCTIKAIIKDDKDRIIATGLAREVIGKTPINKFSYVENAETSAWGRVLGNFGIGIDEDICTAEEMVYKNSHDNEPKSEPLKEADLNKINSCKNKPELAGVCAILRKELGDEYYQSIKDSYKKRIEEIENENI